MRKKPAAEMKPKPTTADKQSQQTMNYGRDGLGSYIQDPTAFPSRRVVYYNDKFVVINDLFPKATVHLLILPRDPVISRMKPQQAFDDPQFLADCLAEEKKVRQIAVDELRRKIGQVSAAEKSRNEAIESEELPDELPAGRDWDKEIMSGTHANPSMNHLHIHVLSRDLHSVCLKKTNHYLSFTTDFFIRMHEYPLAQQDSRRDHFKWASGKDMFCWRCGRDFKNQIARLKAHLEEEFEEWKKE
jgi:aprataxin